MRNIEIPQGISGDKDIPCGIFLTMKKFETNAKKY